MSDLEHLRKPILTVTNRKNQHYTDFLNLERLMERYNPLMKSIYNNFFNYNNFILQTMDAEDLWSQIQYEFIALYEEFDPSRNIDFAGYIKMNLFRRVNTWVKRTQNIVQNERPAKQYTNTTSELTPLLEVEDSSATIELELCEALTMVQSKNLTDNEKTFIIDFLYHKLEFEELVAKHSINPDKFQIYIKKLCNKLIKSSTEKARKK